MCEGIHNQFSKRIKTLGSRSQNYNNIKITFFYDANINFTSSVLFNFYNQLWEKYFGQNVKRESGDFF